MRLRNVYFLGAALFAALALVLPLSASAQPQESEPEPEEGVAPDAEPEAAETVTAEPEAPVAPEETGAAVTEPAAARPLAGYDKGFLISSEDGRFGMKVQARVQSRYTLSSVEDAATGERDETSNFAIQRARLSLGGHAFEKGLTYKFQADFGRGTASLKDFYIDYALSDGVLIRTGQWKKPFSRQQITSSGSLSLVDRALTDREYKAGRDIGFGIHNDYEKSPEIEWALGVFNGAGEGTVPDKFSPVAVARIGYNQGGIKGYSEADLEGGPLRFGVAAGVQTELDYDDSEDDADPEAAGDGAVRAEVDYIVKVNGLSSTGGVYVDTLATETDGFAEQSYRSTGFHLQAGYMLAEKHQVAGRYTLVSVDAGATTQEVTLGYSLYAQGHNFKWQTDVTANIPDGGSIGDRIQLRTQLQLAF